MTLRLATPADKPRLITMAARFLLESRYGTLFDNKATPATLGELVTNVLALGAIIVAEHETEIVGMLAIVVVPHPLTGITYADEIAWWVEPEHRHGLIGPKMLREAEDWATRNGANMVKMVAPAGSSVGNFYKLMGYEAVESAYIKQV